MGGSGRSRQVRGVAVRSILSIVTVAVVGWPFLHGDRKCHVAELAARRDRRWNLSPRDVPLGLSRTGFDEPVMQFGTCFVQPVVLAVFLGKLLHPHEGWSCDMAFLFWNRLYAVCLVGQTLATSLGQTGSLALCIDATYPIFASSNLVYYVGYIVCQTSLARLTLLRVELVASAGAALTARRYLQCGLFFCVMDMVVFAIWGFVDESRIFLLILAFVTLLIMVFYVLFLRACYKGLWKAASHADEEMAVSGRSSTGPAVARLVARSLLGSASTSLVYIVITLVMAVVTSHPLVFVVYELAIIADILSDTILVLASLDLILTASGGRTGSQRERSLLLRLQSVGDLVQQRRQRLVEERLRDAALAASGPALALAAMIEGTDPDDLMVLAKARFRAVSWQVLKQNAEIITCGATLEVIGAGSAALYSLSQPCALSACDVFFTHSWKDEGKLKWELLETWCNGFEAAEGRPPLLWLDKVCIDQKNIDEELRCLPVFLGGCNSLLVASGLTYPTRLWCALELFVYMLMAVHDEATRPPIILPLSRDDAEKNAIAHAWRSFAVEESMCYNASGKERILRIMSRMPGGLTGFNSYIQTMAQEVVGTGKDSIEFDAALARSRGLVRQHNSVDSGKQQQDKHVRTPPSQHRCHKKRILRMVRKMPGGLQGFNSYICDLASELGGFESSLAIAADAGTSNCVEGHESDPVPCGRPTPEPQTC